MHEETFNLSIRKFLKLVGVNSQREIEQAVRTALEEGRIKGDETFSANVTLTVADLNLNFKIDGEIKLQ
jgi:predicted component of type VI protein secretion system